MVTIRAPVTSSTGTDNTCHYAPPSPAWMNGTWHVTHSSLPMWKDKRRVTITYTTFEENGMTKFDNLVEYYAAGSKDKKQVRGIETPQKLPNGNTSPSGVWLWRGKGWLKIASSRWEILGHSGHDRKSGEQEQEQWVVIYFAKTMFTPAGIDLLARTPSDLTPAKVEEVLAAVKIVDDSAVQKLAQEMFAVQH